MNMKYDNQESTIPNSDFGIVVLLVFFFLFARYSGKTSLKYDGNYNDDNDEEQQDMLIIFPNLIRMTSYH